MKKVIIDDVDVSWCERFISPTRECLKCETVYDEKCKGKDCDYKRLQRLKQQYADVLKLAKENADSNEYCLQELEKENEYLKKCCTQAGEELSKHSFKWDGKEKNLVVQAMELNERFDKLEKENERLKAELKKYEDMAKKGLDEFKDVGGCWGCGIQESLNQAWADCKNYRQALQEIRELMHENDNIAGCEYCYGDIRYSILAKINEVIGAE